MTNKLSVLIHLSFGTLTMLNSVSFAQNSNPQNCVSYYDKGISTCAQSALPVWPMPTQTISVSPTSGTNQIDEYLANYGKPPREFVAFYLNPTPENARRWAATYQQMQQKSLSLAESWTRAEQDLVQYNPPKVSESGVVTEPSVNIQNNGAKSISNSALPALKQGPRQLFPVANMGEGGVGQLSLTYYFSANCPYCARQRPELTEFARQNEKKLTLTCIDLTPLSATHKPDPNNIEGIPCTWRAATDAEISQNQIRQTPTFKIERPGQEPQYLAGYQSRQMLQSLMNTNR